MVQLPLHHNLIFIRLLFANPHLSMSLGMKNNISKGIFLVFAALSFFKASALDVPTVPKDSKEIGQFISFGTMDSDVATVVTYDPQGNFYVGGITEGTLSGATGEGGFFIRAYTPDGREMWTRQFGSEVFGELEGIAVDPKGHLYVVGVSYGCLNALCRGPRGVSFLNKYDLKGTLLWSRSLSRFEASNSMSVAVDSKTREVYVALSSYLENLQDTSDNIAILKFDESGEELWSKSFGLSNESELNAITVDEKGHFAIFGSTMSTFPGQSKVGSTDLFVRMYDAKGKELWTKQFGSKGYDNVVAAEADAQGNLYIMGNTAHNKPLTGQTESGLFIRKYTDQGEEKWTRVLPNSVSTEKFGSFALDKKGNAHVFTRSEEAPSKMETEPTPMPSQMRAYDPDGKELWVKDVAGPYFIYDMAVNNQGVVAVVGEKSIDPSNPEMSTRDAFIYIKQP